MLLNKLGESDGNFCFCNVSCDIYIPLILILLHFCEASFEEKKVTFDDPKKVTQKYVYESKRCHFKYLFVVPF